jgi:hypothetical protein
VRHAGEQRAEDALRPWSSARQASVQATGTRSDANEKLTKASQNLAAFENSLEASRRQLKDAQDAAAKNPETRNAEARGDSFSVYGSFDAGGSGEKSALGFNIGKVFSTGVAAQNLTSAARSGSVLNCISKVSELSARITDEGKRAEFMLLAAANCKN